MKKLLITSLFCVSLLSCEKTQVGSSTGIVKKEVNYIQVNSMKNVEIREFDYKGHTYIYTYVHNGISLTHSGSCKCNQKLK